MADCIILVRLKPTTLLGLTEENGENLAIFDSFKVAEILASNHPLCKAFPYQIVELEI